MCLTKIPHKRTAQSCCASLYQELLRRLAACDTLEDWLTQTSEGLDLELSIYNDHLCAALQDALKGNPDRAWFLLADSRTRVFVENTCLVLLKLAHCDHMWAYVRLPLLTPTVCTHVIAAGAGVQCRSSAHPAIKAGVLSYVALSAGVRMRDVFSSAGTPFAPWIATRPPSVLTHVHLTVSDTAPRAACTFGGVRWELVLRVVDTPHGCRNACNVLVALRGTACWHVADKVPRTAVIGARVSAHCFHDSRRVHELEPSVFVWPLAGETVLWEVASADVGGSDSTASGVRVVACIDRVM
jgi:hypothetical protein